MKGKCVFNLNFLLILCLCIAGISCSNDPDQQSYVNISDQYEIKLHQQLTEEGGVPSIELTSIEKHECQNAFISNFSVVSEQKTQLFLNEILVEGECIEGNDFIKEDILLNSTKSELPIEIIVKNAIYNNGILYSNNQEFKLTLEEFDGLKINKTEINRIQPSMLWGSFSTSNNELLSSIQEYFGAIDLGISEKKGDYGLFYLDQNYVPAIYESNNDFSFLISTNEDFENIKNKILEYKQLDESLVLQATNFDGSVINVH